MVEYLEGEYRLIESPLPWQIQGLQETASGYGARLTSSRMVVLPDGIKRRVYITIYGNVGSAWIRLHGKRLYLRD